jgi:hypothetical protein
MKKSAFKAVLVMTVASVLLPACATKPKDAVEPKWEMATRQEVASKLDLEVAKAAKEPSGEEGRRADVLQEVPRGRIEPADHQVHHGGAAESASGEHAEVSG